MTFIPVLSISDGVMGDAAHLAGYDLSFLTGIGIVNAVSLVCLYFVTKGFYENKK